MDELKGQPIGGPLVNGFGYGSLSPVAGWAAAEGVLTIVTANMANAIRSRTVQKGIDPRDYALVAFGGAGPMQAVRVAEEAGIVFS